jgi:hypothetical protein
VASKATVQYPVYVGTRTDLDLGGVARSPHSLCTSILKMYSASKDFPLLGQRLLELQNYMNAQNPSDFLTLWYDRRDILRLYTFWAVFVVGGLGILLSFASVGLTVVQVRQGMNN